MEEVKNRRVYRKPKARFNMRVPADLYYWVQQYAARHHTTVTNLVLRYFHHLKEEDRADRGKPKENEYDGVEQL